MKAINKTALRRAAAYLDGLPHHGCNEVKTLRALIEQSQADIDNGQTAMLPVQRSYDIRAKQLLAFNESRQAGKDVDEALEAAHLAMLRNSSATVEAPAAGMYAIRHLDNWDGEGDIRVSLATYDDKGKWKHDENGAPVLEYRGDKILQAWPLTDTPSPALTYDAGLAAAAEHIREQVAEYTEEHGTWTDDGKVLSAEHKAYIYQLHRIAESIDELASADPVPCSHVKQPVESVQP